MFNINFENIKKLMFYFAFSCISAVLDFAITSALFNLFLIHYIIANTIGIIAGFILHFMMSSKAVFKVRLNTKSFVAYLITFLIGLILANTVLFVSFEIFKLNFNISKFLSMGLPFFAIYFLRTITYGLIGEQEHDKQGI
jgi:putative flippase GtrA